MKARAVVTSPPEFLHYRKKPVKAIQETTESHTRQSRQGYPSGFEVSARRYHGADCSRLRSRSLIVQTSATIKDTSRPRVRALRLMILSETSRSSCGFTALQRAALRQLSAVHSSASIVQSEAGTGPSDSPLQIVQPLR